MSARSLIKKLLKPKFYLCSICFEPKECSYNFFEIDYIFEYHYICAECWKYNKRNYWSQCELCFCDFRVHFRKLMKKKFFGRKSFFLCPVCVGLATSVPCVKEIDFYSSAGESEDDSEL